MKINEKTRILRALKAAQGDVAQAAAQCGVLIEQVESARSWYAEEVCSARVFYQAGADVEDEVQPGSGGESPDVETLPLIVRQMPQVRFRGKVYPTDREGLYRFLWVPECQRNLIVVHDEKSVRPILEGLANLHIHGNRDQDATFKQEFQKRFQSQPWVSANCGGIARSARLLLQEFGLKARQVGTLTMDRLNTFSNGHWMLEVRDPISGQWILADLDMGLLFRDRKHWLSLHEFQGKVSRNERPDFYVLSRKTCDPFFMADRRPDGFNHAYLVRWQCRNPAVQWEWYRRNAQVAGLYDETANQVVYFGDVPTIRALHGEQTCVISEAEWIRRFYDIRR